MGDGAVPSSVQLLIDTFPELRVRTCDQVVKELRISPEGIPRTYVALEAFLGGANVQYREHDWIEFKAPQNGLVKSMCKNITKAVCAMLNSTSGYVMIGVEESPTAKVVGFEKTYEGTLRAITELENILENAYFRKIEPNPRFFISLWSFSVPDTAKIVTLVWVEKGNNRYQYDFDGRGLQLYRRVGTQSVIA